MSLRSRAVSLWRNLIRRHRVERALDDELRAYVELLAVEYERQGIVAGEARRLALVDAGGVSRVKDAVRDAWAGDSFVSVAREVRHALRALRRSPAYVATAVTTLAIGIGGATAVFTVINGTLLRPLPSVSAPDGLVGVERIQPTTTLDDFGYPDFSDLHDQTKALVGLAAYNGTHMPLRDTAGSTQAWVSYVSGDFFHVLGVAPAAGRLIAPDDAVPYSVRPVVVLSYDFWQRRFGGSPGAVGATLMLNGYPLTVIGVAPKRFIGAMTLHPMNLWIPLTMVSTILHGDDLLASRGDGSFRLVGRLAPGRTVADAERELTAIMTRLGATYPEDKGRTIRVYRSDGMSADEQDSTSRLPRLLSIAVGVLLLIACANVAVLALVRAAARRRELATRLALGASHASLVGRLLIEGGVLAAAAAVLGVLLARLLVGSEAITRTIVSMSDPDLRLDSRVLAVALGVSAATALAVSTIPAFQIAHIPVGAVLKDGSGGAVRRRSAGQRALVMVQVAASLVLLASAVIVFSAVRRVLATDPGFDIPHLTFALLSPGQAGLDSAQQRVFYDEVLARTAVDPGLGGAALASTLPPQEWATRATVFRMGEEPTPTAPSGRDFDFAVRPYVDFVSPTLFEVMRIPILRGRAFTARDDDRAPAVVIISQRMARELWPGQDAVGRLLSWPAIKGPPRAPMRVVGVARDTRHASLMADPPLVMYVPFTQHFGGNLFLAARGRGDTPVDPEVLRRAVADVAPAAAPAGATRLSSWAGEALEPQRRATAWIGAFGVIALLLAAIGLYGVVAQGVLQRTRELAVRSALGATPAGIARLVVGDGMQLAGWGVLLGLACSVGAVRVLRSQLAGIGGMDVGGMSVAAAVLAAALLAAAYLPARRAARLNPVDVLRSD